MFESCQYTQTAGLFPLGRRELLRALPVNPQKPAAEKVLCRGDIANCQTGPDETECLSDAAFYFNHFGKGELS